MKKIRDMRQCLPPFQEYHSSGPYTLKSNGRRYINLLGDWGEYRNKTFLYARYLLITSLGELPKEGLDADHIDGNPFNDALTNLKFIRHEDNLKKENTLDPNRLALQRNVRMTCPVCNQSFVKPRRDTHIGKKKGTRTYCSKKCYLLRTNTPHADIQTFEEVKGPILSTLSYFEPWEQWSSPIESIPRDKKENKSHIPIRKIKDDPYTLGIIRKAALKEISWTLAGRVLEVSDNAVKKRAKSLGYLKKADGGTRTQPTS